MYRQERLIGWNFTPITFIKLNTDGASKGNPGPAGAGGVFRDHSGDWMLGYTRHIGYATNSIAEAWAIRDGLQVATQKKFSHILVESDSQTIINLLTNGISDLHILSPIILDCRVLMQQIPQVKFKHI